MSNTTEQQLGYIQETLHNELRELQNVVNSLDQTLQRIADAKEKEFSYLRWQDGAVLVNKKTPDHAWLSITDMIGGTWRWKLRKVQGDSKTEDLISDRYRYRTGNAGTYADCQRHAEMTLSSDWEIV